MGFRFRRSIGVLPGIRLNLSGSGVSVSVGPRGLRYTVGAKGTRITAGIPGTGLSWSQYQPFRTTTNPLQPIETTPIGEILLPVENASASHINAFSTCELAETLSRTQSRWRLAPLLQVCSVLIFSVAAVQANKPWMLISSIYATVFVLVAILLDRYRRSVKVVLEPQDAIAQIADAIAEAFQDLVACHSVWRIQAQGTTGDWKRNAGATTLCRRARINPQFGKPDSIRGRVKFPALRSGAESIYLLPDAALIITRGSVAAVNYHELLISNQRTKFVEEERLPSDAVVVDYTWRYVNKRGGPDARFNSNARLPMCIYGELTFQSGGGLNSRFQYSNPEAADSLCRVLDVLHRTTAKFPKVAYVQQPKGWPTFLFLAGAVIFGLLQLLLLEPRLRSALTEDRASVTRSLDQTSGAPISSVTAADSKRSELIGAASPKEAPKPEPQAEVIPLPRSRPSAGAPVKLSPSFVGAPPDRRNP